MNNKKILEKEIIGIIAKTLKVNNSKIKKKSKYWLYSSMGLTNAFKYFFFL